MHSIDQTHQQTRLHLLGQTTVFDQLHARVHHDSLIRFIAHTNQQLIDHVVTDHRIHLLLRESLHTTHRATLHHLLHSHHILLHLHHALAYLAQLTPRVPLLHKAHHLFLHLLHHAIHRRHHRLPHAALNGPTQHIVNTLRPLRRAHAVQLLDRALERHRSIMKNDKKSPLFLDFLLRALLHRINASVHLLLECQ